MRRRKHERPLGSGYGKAQSVVDDAGGDLIESRQAGEDRQAGGIR